MKVRLVTAQTYRRQGEVYERGKAVEVEDGLGASLLRTKRFEEVADVAEEADPIEPANEPAAEEQGCVSRDNASQGDDAEAEAARAAAEKADDDRDDANQV